MINVNAQGSGRCTNLYIMQTEHENKQNGSIEQLADLFKLLGDKNRLTIISLLKEKELCVCDLVEVLQTSQPNISQHLRKLKDAGLIREARKGQWTYYSLNTMEKPYLELILNQLPSAKNKFILLAGGNRCN